MNSVENTQSRDFITELAQQVAPLGEGATQSRLSVSEFAHYNTYQRYSFPSVDPIYTTALSDVVDYEYSTRTLSGGISIGDALLNAAPDINNNLVSGRTAGKNILLMTDASCYQIEPYSVVIADQLKAQGHFISVMAIDSATFCPILCSDYATLKNDAVSLAQLLRDTACGVPANSASNYLLKDEAGVQFLAAADGTYKVSASAATLSTATALYGVVNLGW